MSGIHQERLHDIIAEVEFGATLSWWLGSMMGCSGRRDLAKLEPRTTDVSGLSHVLLPVDGEEVPQEVQASLNAQKSLAQRHEGGDLLHTIGVEVVELHLELEEQGVEKVGPGHIQSTLVERHE